MAEHLQKNISSAWTRRGCSTPLPVTPTPTELPSPRAGSTPQHSASPSGCRGDAGACRRSVAVPRERWRRREPRGWSTRAPGPAGEAGCSAAVTARPNLPGAGRAEPGSRRGNASVIKGTRDLESAAGCSMGHVSETRPWHCKTRSQPRAPAPPAPGAAHPGGLARPHAAPASRLSWYWCGCLGVPAVPRSVLRLVQGSWLAPRSQGAARTPGCHRQHRAPAAAHLGPLPGTEPPEGSHSSGSGASPLPRSLNPPSVPQTPSRGCTMLSLARPSCLTALRRVQQPLAEPPPRWDRAGAW